MSLLQKIKTQQEKSNTVHKKFMAGSYGLVKTFWLFWFTPMILITIIEAFNTTYNGGLKGNIFIIAWSVITLIAIFNISVEDKKIWKNIALVFVILTIITRVLNLIITL